MLSINLKHTLAIVIVAVGVLASAGSASAGTLPSGLVLYNGHAGLGTSVYQHNQTELESLAFSHPAVAAGVTDWNFEHDHVRSTRRPPRHGDLGDRIDRHEVHGLSAAPR